MLFEYLPRTGSGWVGIERLEPGTILTWRDGRIAVERYWQPPIEQRAIGPDEATERLDELLRGSVRRQIVADVPVGVFLSGGVDSGLITALAAEAAPDLTAFTVRVAAEGLDESFDETPHAVAVARHLGVRHEIVELAAARPRRGVRCGQRAIGRAARRFIAAADLARMPGGAAADDGGARRRWRRRALRRLPEFRGAALCPGDASGSSRIRPACSAGPSTALPGADGIHEPPLFVAPAVAGFWRGGGAAILSVDGAVRARGSRRAVAAIGLAGERARLRLCADRPLRGRGGRPLGGRSAPPPLPRHLSPR